MDIHRQKGVLAMNAQADDANVVIAANLREMADLLEQQEADGFRVGAYRKAADSVTKLAMPLEERLRREGLSGLDAIPGIGKSIAAAIAEMISTGRWAQLERLRGTVDPERLFQTIPGVGPELARRIYAELHIDTLEELEAAAHDDRLGQVKGLGRRRIEMLKASLAERLGRRRLPRWGGSAVPPVAVILDVDREYRDKAMAGTLRKIAPKRFNPTGEAWLPVLHSRRHEWIFTALYSNTQRAHELQKIQDWVVIYFHTDNQPEGQYTVVTETTGSLRGRRVVRGREDECGGYYRVVADG